MLEFPLRGARKEERSERVFSDISPRARYPEESDNKGSGMIQIPGIWTTTLSISGTGGCENFAYWLFWFSLLCLADLDGSLSRGYVYGKLWIVFLFPLDVLIHNLIIKLVWTENISIEQFGYTYTYPPSYLWLSCFSVNLVDFFYSTVCLQEGVCRNWCP